MSAFLSFFTSGESNDSLSKNEVAIAFFHLAYFVLNDFSFNDNIVLANEKAQ